jgi:hypothetical protein
VKWIDVVGETSPLQPQRAEEEQFGNGGRSGIVEVGEGEEGGRGEREDGEGTAWWIKAADK